MEASQIEYIKNQNEREAAERAGKPGETKPVQAQPAVPVDDDDEDEAPASARGTSGDPARRAARRTENRLREEAAEERGRRKALEEMMERGLTSKTAVAVVDDNEDPEPERKDFADDAQYNRALSRWDAIRVAEKLLEGNDTKKEAKRQEQAWLDGVKEMDAKAVEDQKLIPDFAEVAKAAVEAAEEDESLRFSPAEQPTFFALLMQSDVRAFMYHHFAKNPDDLRKILAMKPVQQIPFFNRLEGRVEKMYSTEDSKNVPKEKPVSAAERDAKKPKPSESGAPRGGSAPATTVKPYLEDGRTVNPAWLAKQNEREGLRR